MALLTASVCLSHPTYPGPVRLTDFWQRMERRFGVTYARSYASDMVLAELDSRTVIQALEQGDDVKAVWRAVCDATSAPARER
jgi:hypothetical protein